jgi:hypothetical protein
VIGRDGAVRRTFLGLVSKASLAGALRDAVSD